jgi:hypothetical protein
VPQLPQRGMVSNLARRGNASVAWLMNTPTSQPIKA